MTTPTPETLRADAETARIMDYPTLALLLDAAADAWKLDREFIRQQGERLAEAEKAGRRCDLGRLADFMEANATNLAEGWKWEDDIRALSAALAHDKGKQAHICGTPDAMCDYSCSAPACPYHPGEPVPCSRCVAPKEKP